MQCTAQPCKRQLNAADNLPQQMNQWNSLQRSYSIAQRPLPTDRLPSVILQPVVQPLHTRLHCRHAALRWIHGGADRALRARFTDCTFVVRLLPEPVSNALTHSEVAA